MTRWLLLDKLEETLLLQSGKVPWAITAFRLVALPFLVYTFHQKLVLASYVLFLFAISTDFLDGYLAKKQKTTSRIGSYFDVTADFLFVFGMFLVFVLQGFYEWWLLFLIGFVFAQFMLTSVYLKRTVYDPIGKYYGSLMFGGVGLTLLSQEQLMLSIVSVGVVVCTMATLLSRFVYFVSERKQT